MVDTCHYTGVKPHSIMAPASTILPQAEWPKKRKKEKVKKRTPFI